MYIISDDPSEWPTRRMMSSTGLTALNTPENIAAREPTQYDIDWISPKDAEERWGTRIWTVPDFTVSLLFILLRCVLTSSSSSSTGTHFNVCSMSSLYSPQVANQGPPRLVINHYYHFAAELLMGTWRMLASYDAYITPRGESTRIPTPARAVFPHVEPKVWRDGPRFNQFFLHAVWPGIGAS
jgi:hypothetical protein